MKRAVLVLVLLLLAACAKTAAPETNSTNTTEPVVEPTVPEATEFGRMVITVKDALVDESDIEKLELEFANLELHEASKDSWVKLSTAKNTIDLVTVKDKETVLLDTPLDPGKYTQLRFQLSDINAIIDGKEYDVDMPANYLILNGVFDVTVDQTTVASLDFLLDKSISIAGPVAMLKPVIQLKTFKNADISIENRTATIGGTATTDERYDSETFFTPQQLNNSRKNCLEDCKDECSGSRDGCSDDCAATVTSGCESEDEDICRDSCNPIMHPAICRDGCKESKSECIDYLTMNCNSQCDDTITTCETDCEESC